MSGLCAGKTSCRNADESTLSASESDGYAQPGNMHNEIRRGRRVPLLAGDLLVAATV